MTGQPCGWGRFYSGGGGLSLSCM